METEYLDWSQLITKNQSSANDGKELWNQETNYSIEEEGIQSVM